MYLQKFDVNDDRSNELFWHQYMTNCLAPYNEAKSMYNGYYSSNLLNSSIGFVIPVYENMPEYATSSPSISASDFQNDNTRVYANVTTTLNVRSGPGTSYERLTSIAANQTFTRIGQGVQSGERWDKVLLDNGMVGYVFQTYVEEVPKPTITNIQLTAENTVMNKEETQKLSIQITPSDSVDEIIWKSSNDIIATVENGTVTAVSAGNVIITAQTVNGEVSASLELIIKNPVESIALDNTNINLISGNTMKINATVLPEDATNKNLVWSSENETIATVNENGQITAVSKGETIINVKSSENENISAKCNVKVIEIDEGVYFELDESVTLNGDEISGVDMLTVGEFKELINTNLVIEFYDNSANLLNDDSPIGTGCRLCVKDDNDVEIYNYYFIIYGDVNGDADINALDVLVLQKYILEIRQLDGLFLKAGNISRNGELPNSLDVLKIQKHILEIKFIEQ